MGGFFILRGSSALGAREILPIHLGDAAGLRAASGRVRAVARRHGDRQLVTGLDEAAPGAQLPESVSLHRLRSSLACQKG